MAYQALYRRYRPSTFGEVVGQVATMKTLRHQIQTGHIAHAYLFCGCRGTGKTTMAKLMSRAINCQNPKDGDPCGVCDVCKAIRNETTMDVLELDAASNNSVDHIRELLEQVRYPAQLGQYKVYIIDEVHMLSTAAFNALLKTLEEPPSHVVFILATTEPQKLPATILSRVQRYDFGRIPTPLMIERLQLVLQELSLTADEEALGIVASAAEGAMRDAYSILDMCIAGIEDGHVTAEQVREMLGTSDRSFLFAFMQTIAERDACAVMQKTDELMRTGREPQVFLRELTAHVRALLTVKAVKEQASSLLDCTKEDEARYRQQAEGMSNARLLDLLSLLMKTEGELRYASTPRIALEAVALRACEQNRAEDTGALITRIEELETTIRTLQEGLKSGVVKVSSSKEKTSAPKEKKSADQAPVAKVIKAPPASDKEAWEKSLASLAKTDPPLFGILRNERFIGVQNNVYRVMIPHSKKDFSYVKLNQPQRRERISAVISEVVGHGVGFEAVLEADLENQKMDVIRDEAQQSLIDTFGRDTVQIEEGKTN